MSRTKNVELDVSDMFIVNFDEKDYYFIVRENLFAGPILIFIDSGYEYGFFTKEAILRSSYLKRELMKLEGMKELLLDDSQSTSWIWVAVSHKHFGFEAREVTDIELKIYMNIQENVEYLRKYGRSSYTSF
ncbi:TPA: hypothetical protein QCY19_003044 [Bacillus luti]|nr:hypothetical protein [Bacillus luti]